MRSREGLGDLLDLGGWLHLLWAWAAEYSPLQDLSALFGRDTRQILIANVEEGAVVVLELVQLVLRHGRHDEHAEHLMSDLALCIRQTDQNVLILECQHHPVDEAFHVATAGEHEIAVVPGAVDDALFAVGRQSGREWMSRSLAEDESGPAVLQGKPDASGYPTHSPNLGADLSRLLGGGFRTPEATNIERVLDATDAEIMQLADAAFDDQADDAPVGTGAHAPYRN